jgi:molecular chaperone DnaJ
MRRNLYIVLGVPFDATADDIKTAYRQRALDVHPDRTGTDGGLFRELQEAYEILSDPARRRAYDEAARPPARPPVPAPKPPAEPLRRPPSGTIRSSPWNRGRSYSQNSSVVEIELTPDEAARGGEIELRVPTERICPSCAGSGTRLWRICPKCDGTGIAPAERSVVIGFPRRTRSGHQVPIPLRQGAGRWLMVRFVVSD